MAKTLLERTKWPMTPEEHRIALRKALKQTWRRVDRDKKFRIAFLSSIGVMTKSGKYKKWWLQHLAYVNSLSKQQQIQK